MRCPLLLAAAAAWAGPVLACPAPLPVRLPADEAEASALLLRPPGWEPGDPAAVLHEPGAFRHGCAAPQAAALLEDGVLVLALPTEMADWPRLRSAHGVLREGYGAGHVAVAPARGATGPSFARRIRLAEADASGARATPGR